MKKCKNEEHSRLSKLITEAAMFLKMQNSPAFESLIILTVAIEKKSVSKISLKTLCFAYVNCWFYGSFKVSIWQRHAHSVFLETIYLVKIFLVSLLLNYSCKKSGETINVVPIARRRIFLKKVWKLHLIYRESKCVMSNFRVSNGR